MWQYSSSDIPIVRFVIPEMCRHNCGMSNNADHEAAEYTVNLPTSMNGPLAAQSREDPDPYSLPANTMTWRPSSL